MKQLIQKITLLVASLLLVSAVIAPQALAVSKDDVCRGVDTATGGTSCNPGGTTVDDIVAVVVNTLSTIVGIVSVIMIIIGGFKYITSSGESSNIQSAKNTITYAIVGLIIVAMAQAIVRFVLNRTT